MSYSSIHTHTKFCDGANTPREMIEAAMKLGLRSIGFSGHGYIWFDKESCMSPRSMLDYYNAVCGLRAEYVGKIDVFCGLENDSSQFHTTQAYDYVIGAVHYAPQGENHCSVDNTPALLEKGLNELFNGDAEALVSAYYGEVTRLANEYAPDICAHFDLLKKFNNTLHYFEETSQTYRESATAALQAVVQSGMLLEVNTGGMSRGYIDEPYPSPYLLKCAKDMGAKVIITADAHDAAHLTYRFAEMEILLADIGFSETWELTPKGFVAMPLKPKRKSLWKRNRNQ